MFRLKGFAMQPPATTQSTLLLTDALNAAIVARYPPTSGSDDTRTNCVRSDSRSLCRPSGAKFAGDSQAR